MTEPLLSVITPVYNGEKYIEECIASILRQSYTNIEYIIINDGSTDKTKEIIKKYKKNIKIINQNNMGQVKTLNKGWNMSKGKYLTYLSADDILDSKCYEEIIAFLEKNMNIIMAFPKNHLIDENSKIIKKDVCPEFSFYDTLVRQECKIGAGAIFRKQIFQKYGGWDSKFELCPDRHYWIKIFQYGNFKLIDSALAFYRLHSHSGVYTKTNEKYSNEYKIILDEFFKECKIKYKKYERKAYSYAYIIKSRNFFIESNNLMGFKSLINAIKFNIKFISPIFLLRFVITIYSKRIKIFFSKIIKN